MLDADIRLRLDRLNLDAVLSVQAGEVVALLGPNGAGKSTVLRALSGLLRLDGGKVELDGTVLEEPAKHIRVAPEKRPVGLMFQEYLLFPHLSAVENVAFGLRARGVDKRAARKRAAAALERLGVAKVAEARPGNMSGGQQQRVAMARAMVTEPKLLLLDEPLAALDVSTKTDVRRQLRATLAAHVRLRGYVERGQWLVKQQQLRLGDHRPGHRHPLLLASGHVAGPRLGDLGHAQALQRRSGPLPRRALVDPTRAQPERHVLDR